MAAGGAIEGAAVDDRGAAINSFSVTIESFEPAEGESKETSRAGETRDELRGSFRFDDLAAGTYVIRASISEGRVTEPATIVVAKGKVLRGIVLSFPKAEPDAQEEAAEAPRAPIVRMGESLP
jgi:hypothetical protein